MTFDSNIHTISEAETLYFEKFSIWLLSML